MFKIKHQTQAGFTVIELLVVIGIFALISGITLFNFSAFSGQTTLNNLTYEIALAVREAQVYGIAVRETSPGSEIFPSYGTYFDIDQDTEFILFADTAPTGASDGIYTAEDDLLESFSIRKGNRISELCGFVSPSDPCTAVNELHITFTRPDPEASILDGEGNPYSYARISVTSLDDKTRDVSVWSNGQIAVK